MRCSAFIDITDQGGTTKVLAITKAFGFVTNYKGLGPAYSFSINPKGLIKGQELLPSGPNG